MIKATSLTLVLCFFSITAFCSDRDYTCSDLVFDNKNNTVLAGKNPAFKSVDEFLLFMKDHILQDFPKKVAEKYYEKSKAKGEEYAYANSLGIYKLQLENMQQVDLAFAEGAAEAGGMNKYVSELCGFAKEKDNLEIQSIFYTFIVATINYKG